VTLFFTGVGLTGLIAGLLALLALAFLVWLMVARRKRSSTILPEDTAKLFQDLTIDDGDATNELDCENPLASDDALASDFESVSRSTGLTDDVDEGGVLIE
jgi:hypothetical protein